MGGGRDPMKLAIVGSTSLAGNAEALLIIRRAIEQYAGPGRDQVDEFVVVSGGAAGIDTMAEREAERWGVPTIIYPGCQRRHRHDFQDCFAPRNLKIAETCDRLIRIAAAWSLTYGSGWTRDRAAEMGKPTEEHVVEEYVLDA